MVESRQKQAFHNDKHEETFSGNAEKEALAAGTCSLADPGLQPPSVPPIVEKVKPPPPPPIAEKVKPPPPPPSRPEVTGVTAEDASQSSDRVIPPPPPGPPPPPPPPPLPAKRRVLVPPPPPPDEEYEPDLDFEDTGTQDRDFYEHGTQYGSCDGSGGELNLREDDESSDSNAHDEGDDDDYFDPIDAIERAPIEAEPSRKYYSTHRGSSLNGDNYRIAESEQPVSDLRVPMAGDSIRAHINKLLENVGRRGQN